MLNDLLCVLISNPISHGFSVVFFVYFNLLYSVLKIILLIPINHVLFQTETAIENKPS